LDLRSGGVGSGWEEGWLGGSSSSGRLSLIWVVVESSRRSRPVVDVSGSVHVMIQGASLSMYQGVSGGGGGGDSGGFVLTSPFLATGAVGLG